MLWLVGLLTFLFANKATAQNITVAENIEVHNISVNHVEDLMIISMSFILDDVKVKSNQSIVLTPYLEDWDGTQRELGQPIRINGRKQQIYVERNHKSPSYENAIVIRRFNDEPQVYNYITSIPYQSWMDSYRLHIYEDLCGCGTPLAHSGKELAEYIPLPTIAYYEYKEPEMEIVKARSVEGKAYLDFPVNQTTIYPDYRRNPEELAVIIKTISVVKDDPNISITNINIHGYASPEGSYNSNARLAEGRAEALKEYVRKLYNLPPNLFTVESTPEDWAGRIQWVSDSDLNNKEAILDIANSSLSPDAKDQKIRQAYPEDYRTLLANCYPALRHSDYVINYVVNPFTLKEAKTIITKNPAQLSLYEIYQVASSYPAGSSESIETLKIAAALYPESEEANLNVANMLVEIGDIAAAAPYLERAGELPQAILLRGVIEMKQGNIAEARELFIKAQMAGSSKAQHNIDLIKNFK